MSRLFSLFLVALLPLTSHAAEPLSPDQLLERIRSDRAAEADDVQRQNLRETRRGEAQMAALKVGSPEKSG